MKLVVGLGNPGKEYEKTRHNLGFRAIDLLSEKLQININKAKFDGKYGDKLIKGEKIVLVKPQTYMNLSGDCVSQLLSFYKVQPEDLIVIYDDIDIAIGKIRVKPSGSPGTHNGMKDITKKIASKNFVRVRIGSGKPSPEADLADYVLSGFQKDEEKPIELAIEKAANAVIEVINNGVSEAMNKFNSRKGDE